MQKIAAALLFGVIATSGFSQELYHPDRITKHFINKQNCDQILNNDGYFQTCYSYKHKGAKYVAYKLDGKLVNKKNIKKRPRFYDDLSIPKRYRSHYSDYTRNPYHMDRGHLLADAAIDYSKRSLHAAYAMSNIIPQYYSINRDKDKWQGVERYERSIATKLGSVRTIDGVIYGSKPNWIGHSGVAVPKAFWKMIYNESAGYQKCFYFENNKEYTFGKSQIKDYTIDCRKL